MGTLVMYGKSKMRIPKTTLADSVCPFVGKCMSVPIKGSSCWSEDSNEWKNAFKKLT
jgi:hypothetical protein